MKTLRLLAAVPFALAACRGAAPQAQPDEAGMAAQADSIRPLFDSAVANYNREYNAGHIEPLVRRYAPGAHIMPPNAGPIGRDSLRLLFQAAFKDGRPNGTIDVRVERVIRNGPLAVVRARWVFRTAGTADPPVDSGSSVTVWTPDQAGRWNIIEDIWHSDLPVPVAPPPVRRR